MFRQSASRIPLRAAALVLAVLALVLGAVLVAHAALITINTDDGQVDPQWQLAAPPITDPAGDNTQSPQNPNNDIIAGWAASGPEGVSPPTTYYFLMQVAGTTAIQDGYLAVAAVDCDGDGFMNNSSDRYVAYNPALDFVHTRDQAFGYIKTNCPFTPPATGSCSDGERMGSYVEWRWNFSADGEYAWPILCKGLSDTIRIGFGVVPVPTAGFSPAVDETPGGFEFNPPTMVTLTRMSAERSATPWAVAGTALLALGAGLLVGRRLIGR